MRCSVHVPDFSLRSSSRILAAALVALAMTFAGAAEALPPCVECDVLYAADCNFGLWKIDPNTATSTFIGLTPDFLFDVALTPDGQLFGVDSSSQLWQLDPCTAAGTLLPVAPGGNGLAASLPLAPQPPSSAHSAGSASSAAFALFGQGPPLVRIEPSAPYTLTVVGGEIGSGVPFWCATSSGDLAMHPVSHVFYSTVGVQLINEPETATPACPSCGGDILITVSPQTGEMLDAVGCIHDESTGAPIPSVWGLAFDSQGRLWGVQGEPTAVLLKIDPTTGSTQQIPMMGGFTCGEGLASTPCPTMTSRVRRAAGGFRVARPRLPTQTQEGSPTEVDETGE